MSEGLDTKPATSPPVAPPPVELSRYVAFALIAVVGLAADLVTKAIVFSWPGKLTGQVYWLWEGHVGFQTSLNEGALFGLGFGHVPVFAAISVLAAIAIPVWLFVFRAANDWWLTASLGAVMAGVLGNLYDRLGMSGDVWPAYDPRAGETVYAVRDWILWQINDDWRWPNFNLADAFLVVGAGVLFLRAMFEPAPTSAARSETATNSPATE